MHSPEFEEKRRKLESEILELRLQRKTIREIAETVGRSINNVGRIIAGLIRIGRLDRFYAMSSSFFRANVWCNLENGNTKRLILLVNQRYTQQSIALEFNITKSRVQKIIQFLKSKFGAEIFRTEERMYSVDDVAELFNVGVGRVLIVLKDIGCRRGACGSYIITYEVIQRLFNDKRLASSKVCPVCNKSFSIGVRSRQRHSTYCSDLCGAVMKKNNVHKKATEDSLRGWRLKFFKALQNHTMPAEEEWIGLFEACKLTGLGPMQISFLSYSGLVVTRSYPRKFSYGGYAKLYAKSQLELAKKIYQAHASNNSKTGD